VTREFTRLVVAALCCIPAISIAASDDPKEIERLLAKVRNEPIVFILASASQMPVAEAAASGSLERANLMRVLRSGSGISWPPCRSATCRSSSTRMAACCAKRSRLDRYYVRTA